MSHPLFPRSLVLRPRAVLTVLTAALAAGPLAGAARAQVTTDDSALSTLAPAPKHTAPGATTARHPRPAARTQPQATATAHAPQAASARPAAPAAPPPIPAAPPPPPIIRPPVVDVPLHPPAPPPETVAVAGATGTVQGLPAGLRLTFARDNADMNAAMIDRVKGFAATLLQVPYARAEIDATASGLPDDVSTPRRVSLSRGLAIRSILIHAGIASTRIYVRAIGLPPAGTPDGTNPDHVDVTRSDMVASPSSAASSPPAPSEPRPAP